MINKFPSRIVLAWIALGVAMILLTLSVTYAQSVSLIRKDNGEVKFKYKSTGKKNSQSIDTIFKVDNDQEFYSTMQGISDKYGLNLSMMKDRKSDSFKGKGQKGFTYSMHISSDDKKNSGKGKKGESGDIHIEIDRSMRELEEELKGIEASMANMKFEMHINDDDDLNINIHGNHPNQPSHPIPPSSPSSDKEHIEINIDNNGKRTKIIKKYDHEDLSIPDSLDNDDHVIVFGDKGEAAPELEKVIIKENGRQIFIFKRKKNK